MPGTGHPVQVFDSATGAVRAITPGPTARMYVCGITPYDATHMGHAATYVTFDILGRALRDAGHDVEYVQNITDVDDPLLERATRDGINWEDLAAQEIALFREDMTALAVDPARPLHRRRREHRAGGCGGARAARARCGLRGRHPGVRAATTSTSTSRPTSGFGAVSNWTREQMLAVFADRGGDPDRAGKRDELDPLLWRAAREGEPSWPVEGPARRPAGLAHRVHGHRPGPPRACPSTSRAAGPTWSSRTTR